MLIVCRIKISLILTRNLLKIDLSEELVRDLNMKLDNNSTARAQIQVLNCQPDKTDDSRPQSKLLQLQRRVRQLLHLNQQGWLTKTNLICPFCQRYNFENLTCFKPSEPLLRSFTLDFKHLSLSLEIYLFRVIQKQAKILYPKIPFKFGCILPQNMIQIFFFWRVRVKNEVAQPPQSFKMAQNTTWRKFLCAFSCNNKI